MNALLFGLAAALCVVVGVRGLIMARNPGAVADEGGYLVPDAVQDDRGLVARLILKYSLFFAPWMMARTKPESLAKLERRLDYAGRPDDTTVEELVGGRVVMAIMAVFTTVTILLITDGALWSYMFLLLAGYLDFWLYTEEKNRQKAIEKGLPDVLDVLAVTVSAGLGYRAAVSRVTTEMKGPASDELERTMFEIDLGMGRREAFMRLRDRNSSRVMRRYVVAQTQADELGAPLAGAIRAIAKDSRQMYEQATLRTAGRRASIMTALGILIGMPLLILAILVTMLFSAGFIVDGTIKILPT
jgi:tight adherence protein C